MALKETPERSPIRKRPMRITQGQKQALIDNLQLEITERARKLRAQYALQAQSLRTRVELRVNRIPKSLRTVNIGELLLRHTDAVNSAPELISKPIANPTTGNALRKKITTEEFEATSSKVGAQTRGTKRNSDNMTGEDKENAPERDHLIPNPKKRTKATGAVPSRQVTNPSTVLSPKSSNSRTIPQSPVRLPFGSPQKSYISRPISPLKPVSPFKATSPAKAAAMAASSTLVNLVAEKLKPGRPAANTSRKASKPVVEQRGPTTRAKRCVANAQIIAQNRTVSSSSNVSGVSTGTTVFKAKPVPAAKTAVKKGVAISAAGKKVAAATADVSTTGRRVLRKRA